MTSNAIPSTPYTSSHPAASETHAKVGNAAGKHAGALVPAAAVGGVSTDLVSELNNIDLQKMIGGPAQAAINAQIASSMATVSFIRQVGFKYPTKTDETTGLEVPDYSKPGELVMADFSHTRKQKDKDGHETSEVETVELKVPLLAMVLIPAVRLDHLKVVFNAKLNSVESASISDQLGVDASVSGGWGPVSFKVTASYQRQTTTNVEVKKEYTLGVEALFVQDEMPAGLERVLSMLAA